METQEWLERGIEDKDQVGIAGNLIFFFELIISEKIQFVLKRFLTITVENKT